MPRPVAPKTNCPAAHAPRHARLPALLLGAVALFVAGATNLAAAQTQSPPRTIRVLWYSYAHPQSSYRKSIDTLAANAHRLPKSAGYAWTLSWFAPGDPAPAFERYDVLVIQSGEAFGSADPASDKEIAVDFRGILKHKDAIRRARGTRTVLTGADADVHAIGGASGNAPRVKEHMVRCKPVLLGRNCWDGAVGHLVNAVNWAASGKAMGVVSLVAAEFPGSQWWLLSDSFLRDELSPPGLGSASVVVFGPGTRENTPVIPWEISDHALNAGLTSKGLGNWDNSFHAGFSKRIPGYFVFVASTRYPELAMAIAAERAPKSLPSRVIPK